MIVIHQRTIESECHCHVILNLDCNNTIIITSATDYDELYPHCHCWHRHLNQNLTSEPIMLEGIVRSEMLRYPFERGDEHPLCTVTSETFGWDSFHSTTDDHHQVSLLRPHLGLLSPLPLACVSCPSSSFYDGDDDGVSNSTLPFTISVMRLCHFHLLYANFSLLNLFLQGQD